MILFNAGSQSEGNIEENSYVINIKFDALTMIKELK